MCVNSLVMNEYYIEITSQENLLPKITVEVNHDRFTRVIQFMY